MKNKKVLILLVLLFIGVLFSGCSVKFNSGKKVKAGPDGGVYVSINKGETWQQVAYVPTIKGSPENISDLNANFLTVDPLDSEAVYFGSVEKGLYYTYNIANGWNHAKGLSEGEVNAVAIDFKNKCIIYAAIGNKVYQSSDCNRNFSQIYFDNNPKTIIHSIVVDHYDSNKIFIGTSRGEIIKSMDGGKSWMTIFRSNSEVEKIVMSPKDSRLIFAGTRDKGFFRSTDGGDEWLDLKENLKEFKNSSKIKDLAIAKDKEGLIFIATTYGLLKSPDNGETWSKIELITPEKESTINSLSVNPKNSNEIYYVTNTTFYSSNNGGTSWITRKLPTARAGWKVLVNPEFDNVVYLGVRLLQKNNY